MKKIFEDKSTENGSDFHIRLYSRKLPSGKCQVKFYLDNVEGGKYYGYLLAEGKDTVSRVVARIHRCITDYSGKTGTIYSNLKTITRDRPAADFLLFEQN
jgi:hypothetical protein